MKAVWAYFTIRARHSGPLGELEDLAHDFQPGGNLPQEEQESQAVQGDVGVPGELVSLLHGWGEGRRDRPHGGHPRPGKQVGPREELPRPHPRVKASLDAEGDPGGQKHGGPHEVLVLELSLDELLPGLRQVVDLGVQRGGGDRGRGLVHRRPVRRDELGLLHRLLLLLQVRDLVPDRAHPAPLPAEVPDVPRGAQQGEHHRGVDERNSAALQDSELTALGEGVWRD
mmetsp:Transcript_5835/g.20964  ORF Transcript_5835/g.20964 Transcript_5835/m.20964 type:complete len:227 (-) Transcript_5835:370-1050(-)